MMMDNNSNLTESAPCTSNAISVSVKRRHSVFDVTPLRQHNDWYFMLDSATPKMKRYGVNDSDSFSD